MPELDQNIAINTEITQIKALLHKLNGDNKVKSKINNLLDKFSLRLSSLDDLTEDNFDAFYYYPGIVLIINEEQRIIFQNKPVFGKTNIINEKITRFDKNRGKLTEAINKVVLNGEPVEFNFIEPNGKINYSIYICNYYHGFKDYVLIILNPKQFELNNSKNQSKIYLEAISTLEKVNLPIKFYRIERSDIKLVWKNNHTVYEEEDYDIIRKGFGSELSVQQKKNIIESLDEGEMKIYRPLKEGALNKISKEIVIPVSKTHACVISQIRDEIISKSRIENTKDKFSSIASSMSDIFFILNSRLYFTFVAPSIEKIFNYKCTELIGNSFDILVPKWSGNTLRKKLNTIHKNKYTLNKPYNFSIQLSGKNGNLKWYEVQITGIYNPQNDLMGYNGICRDITERLKYEEALKQAKQRAEKSDMLKTTFLANMSHEIRTPLNGIIGFSSMLNNRELSKEKKSKYSDFIMASSKQLLTIINDIIDISKIEAGQLEIIHTKVNLKALCTELYETIIIDQKRLKKTDIKIIYTIPKNFNAYFFTDEVRLRQVLLNLLSNAIKFTCSGTIKFGYHPFDNNRVLRFYVRDTGIGISSECQKEIFSRFHQGNLDRDTKLKGTGLGLAISKGIIELLGGSIGLNSEEDKGTEFYFTLPLKKEY